MTSFSCQRCRQPVLLASTLSSSTEDALISTGEPSGEATGTGSVSASMALTQSTYDLMQSEAFLVRHVGRGTSSEGASVAAAAAAAKKRGARQRGLLGGLAAGTFTSTAARDEARIKALTSLANKAHAAKGDQEAEGVREALRKSAAEKRERKGKSVGGAAGGGESVEKGGKASGVATSSAEAHKESASGSDKAAASPTTSKGATAAPASASPAPNSLSSRLSLTTSLFDLLSSTASKSRDSLAIDHPLCKECTDLLLEIMNAQMEELRRERDAYIAFGDEVGKGKEDGGAERERLMAEIEELEKTTEAVTNELRAAEADRLAVEEELRALEEEEARLEAEETSFWQEHSTLQTTLSSLSSRRSSLLTSIAHDEALLSRLQHTNVYNDAFCIGHDGGFATINGLRLGRLPNAPASSSGGRGGNVDWIEINAAWGQTVLLLATLARKCGFEFEGYVLHPRGNFSTIEKLPASTGGGNASSSSSSQAGERTVYELHGSGDWQIGRMFQSRRFDHGMVAFLECLRQLGDWAQRRDPSLRLPHAINKDRIGEASIRLQFGSDENWTRALRHVLLTLKVLLSWAVNSADDDDEEGEEEEQEGDEEVV